MCFDGKTFAVKLEPGALKEASIAFVIWRHQESEIFLTLPLCLSLVKSIFTPEQDDQQILLKLDVFVMS